MIPQAREQLRLLIDREQRRRLNVRAAPSKPRSGQCRAAAYLGGRCMNTAVDGSYCYLHKETA